jgi:hypothetical protein
MVFETNLNERLQGLLADVRMAAERDGCTLLRFNVDVDKGFTAALEWPGGDWAMWGRDFYDLRGHLERALQLFFPEEDGPYRPEELSRVIARLGDSSGGSKYLFFTRPKGSLARPDTGVPRTPLEALREGDFDAVMRTAHGHSER